MITIEEAGAMLDGIAETLPPEIYKYLNGGIILSPETKLHPESVSDDMYILGEYHCNRSMGRYINIYFGSFAAVYGHLQPDAAEKRLREILTHEFTHHLESLAGERDLAIEDAIKLQLYKQRKAQQNL